MAADMAAVEAQASPDQLHFARFAARVAQAPDQVSTAPSFSCACKLCEKLLGGRPRIRGNSGCPRQRLASSVLQLSCAGAQILL